MSDPAGPRRVLEPLLQGTSEGRWNDLAAAGRLRGLVSTTTPPEAGP